MKSQPVRHNQRGVALFAVLFALLLLSVIGLGMMYSTNTETSINTNYKDAQVALYSSMGGLQEGRDRIQPATGTITPPTAMPLTSAANVIYIINPRSGETVAPWSTNTSTYPDTELCQEKVMGLTGTFGVPCTTLPTGSSWYSVINDSQTANAPWNLASPTDVKWTRITLKGNNTTPVPVNGNASTATQVCWDGTQQITLPSGYGTNCRPNGSIATLVLNTPGTGYTSTPSVSIAAPPAGGTQATATANFTTTSSGQVSTITLTNPGTGYTSVPTVTITGSGGSGSGATAVTTIAGGAGGAPIASLTLNAGTACYSTAPTVTISGGGGSGATATVALAGAKSCITGWSPTAHCTSNPPKNNTITGITLSGGGAGTDATGTAVFDSGGHINSGATIQNPGTNYTINPTTASGGTPALGSCVVTPNANAGYRLGSVTLTNGGAGYTGAPTISLSPAGAGTTATQPSLNATLGAIPGNAGQITAITVGNPGSGYILPLTVTITGGGGSGATATATTSTITTITGLTLTNAGAGYLSDPAVTISGGGGTGASATATIGRGPSYGNVYQITSFAQTPSGARSMMQMEAVTPVLGYASTGALTLDGPSPILGTFPHSQPFYIRGNDANSCGETPDPVHPAIDGYDDPNANPATHSVQTIVDSLPRPDHYVGDGGCPTCDPVIPSVQNGFESLGETMGSPNGLKALIDAIHAYAVTKSATDPTHAAIYSNPSNILEGDATHPVVDYVDGDFSKNNLDGYGILVVTGALGMGGNFNWHGLILVVGDGEVDMNGGGNGQVTGTVIVANIWDNHTNQNLLSQLGSPSFNWNGGGGNGIQFDHCWADNLMTQIPFTPPPSTKPLKILSVRNLP